MIKLVYYILGKGEIIKMIISKKINEIIKIIIEKGKVLYEKQILENHFRIIY